MCGMKNRMYFAIIVFTIVAKKDVEAASLLTQRCKFTNISVKYNTEYLSAMKAWVDENATVNVDLNVTKMLNFGLRTSMSVQYKIVDSNKYQTLFTYDLDTCKTLSELLHESLMRSWFRNVLKYGHLMDKCPIPEGFYDVRRFAFEEGSIPAYLRPGDYRVNDINYFGKPKAKNRRLVASIIMDLKFY